MNNNDAELLTQLLAGQIAVLTELLNIMIDKGITTPDEARRRFERLKRDIGSSEVAGPGYQAVIAMITYLDSRGSQRGEPPASH